MVGRLGVIAVAVGALALGFVFGASGSHLEVAATGSNGKIVFASDRHDMARLGGPPSLPSGIFSMNADGTGIRRLTQLGLFADPTWSPDESRIAYTEQTSPTLRDIYTMNADGGRVRQVTRSGAASQPDWSPDGKKLAFSSVIPDNCGFHVWVINVDGSSAHRLTSGCPEERDPAWSPKARRIAYTRYVAGDANWEIFVAGASGRGVRRLTHNQGADATPAWSSDGSKIVFASERDGGPGLFVMNAVGSQTRRLTRGSDREPTWSPDGKKIVFVRDDDLYAMNSDGSNQVDVTNTPYVREFEPDWQARLLECLVPRVIGLRLAVARSRLERAHCTIGRVRRRHSSRAGRVLSQKPRAGARRAAGTKVRLVVGRRS